MIKIYRGIFLGLAPWLLLALLETTVLPLDFFTFRAWEAVKTNLFTDALPGPFYPEIDQHFMEATDQDPRRQKKLNNRWKTDRFGQRNARLPGKKENFGVLVGDSNVDGSSLDQGQIFSEELTRTTGMQWINLTHEYMNPWEHPACRENMPQTIVFQLKRGSLLILPKLGGRTRDPRSSQYAGLLRRLDHASKFCCLNKLRAALGLPPLVARAQLGEPHLGLLLEYSEKILSGGFLARQVNAADWSRKNPETILTEYAAFCRQRGIGFLVVVLPDKIRNADEMILRLQANGVSVVGFLPSAEWPHGADLDAFWQTQDSHWTARGVQIAASEVFKWLSVQSGASRPSRQAF